jgi:hypothetical protein
MKQLITPVRIFSIEGSGTVGDVFAHLHYNNTTAAQLFGHFKSFNRFVSTALIVN